jgi:uncharacterized radical SAM protein YgiQ
MRLNELIKPDRCLSQPLPMTMEECRERGWDSVDVVFVSGDAYVDHPSFAAGILGRALEAAGFRVAILAQPNWRNCEAWKTFGKPRLFFAISAGNMDSMINHYTANKKIRSEDAYSPGGRTGLRPDRATLAYCQRAREAWPGVPVIAGGVEASLRRLAHYDYWSDTVKRSIVLDSKADLVVHGMGEKLIVEIATRMELGATIKDLKQLRGVAWALGASSTPPSTWEGKPVVMLPSFEQVSTDKMAFAEATKLMHHNTNPFNARLLIQPHGSQWVVATPPLPPLEQAELDCVYDLPYTRRPHPLYREKIPAHTMIKDSVSIMRGCFGGCNFCSITAHQGKIVQSRSERSILAEIKRIADDPDSKGIVSDIGGPTANMWNLRCTHPEVEVKCRRPSCVAPTMCSLLGTDHGPLVSLMRKARSVPGIRRVFVASGVRMDLAQNSPEYLEELAAHHVSGLLKVAPEHVDPQVLTRMRKPPIENFERFGEKFREASAAVGKPKQYLVPYFIASHPGSGLEEMITLALFLKRNGYKPDQVQDFIPAPYDIATAMYWTGIDPFTKEEIKVARGLRERKMQRALMQFFKPENWFTVREALVAAGREDLIGNGCDALIPANPPREALEARRAKAARDVQKRSEFASNRAPRSQHQDSDHYHAVGRDGKEPAQRLAARRSKAYLNQGPRT